MPCANRITLLTVLLNALPTAEPIFTPMLLKTLRILSQIPLKKDPTFEKAFLIAFHAPLNFSPNQSATLSKILLITLHIAEKIPVTNPSPASKSPLTPSHILPKPSRILSPLRVKIPTITSMIPEIKFIAPSAIPIMNSQTVVTTIMISSPKLFQIAFTISTTVPITALMASHTTETISRIEFHREEAASISEDPCLSHSSLNTSKIAEKISRIPSPSV